MTCVRLFAEMCTTPTLTLNEGCRNGLGVLTNTSTHSSKDRGHLPSLPITPILIGKSSQLSRRLCTQHDDEHYAAPRCRSLLRRVRERWGPINYACSLPEMHTRRASTSLEQRDLAFHPSNRHDQETIWSALWSYIRVAVLEHHHGLA